MTTQLRRRESGFSLIELMVSILIGLFLTGGLVYSYIGAKRSYNFNQAMSRIQENGRFAIHVLTRNIREAGYMSCAQNTGRITNTLDTATGNYLWQFTAGVDGFDNVGSQWPAPLSNPLHGEETVSGSDVIAVRKAGDTAVPTSEIESDQPYIVTDCTQSTIYKAAADEDSGSQYVSNGKVFTLTTSIYYLAQSSYADVPSLWQQESNDSSADELVPGVQNMQILYGEDTNGDRAADTYQPATQIVDMDNVISVRIALLLTSLHEVAQQPIPYDFTVFQDSDPKDRYLRSEFIVTIHLRNRSI